MASTVPNGVSVRGIELIQRFEGLHLTAYPDPLSGGDPITAGWGSTRNLEGSPFRLGDTLTRTDAHILLVRDVAAFYRWVRVNVRVPLSQGQVDGFTSFVYNLGPTKVRSSTAFRRLNTGDYDGCADAMSWWVSPGTRVERGLRLRRTEEIKIFRS